MLGAQTGPQMDEDSVGPRHGVAGGPVGYEHGMRDGMGPHNSPGDYAGATAQGKRAGRERPVLGARNGPRMDEDPVGPRHRVAGGPVGYKHRMRDGMGPHNSPRDKAGAEAQGNGTGAGRERPVLGAGSGPRMEQDPVAPCHRVAGDPDGYKHGMMGQGDGAGKGVWLGPHNCPTG